MGVLTDTLPKPLLKIGEKNLLELKFDILPASIEEVIVVVGYLGDKIQETLGAVYKGKRVRYVVQSNPAGGTADALWSARDMLHDRFVIMMGDDLYSATDLEACSAVPDWGLLVSPMEGARSGGNVHFDLQGTIGSIEEGEHEGVWYACTNLFVLDSRIFATAPVPKAPGSSELGLPQTVLFSAQKQGISIQAVPATGWIQITDQADIARVEAGMALYSPNA